MSNFYEALHSHPADKDLTFYTDIAEEEQVDLDHIEKRREYYYSIGEQEVVQDDYGSIFKEEHDGLKHRDNKRTIKSLMRSSTPHQSGIHMYRLLRRFHVRSYMEMGACLGLGASYALAAMIRNNWENKGGYTFKTLEGCANLSELTRESLKHVADHMFESEDDQFHRIEVVTGPFAKTFLDTLDEYPEIHAAFIDGLHYAKATYNHFNILANHMPNGGIIIVDDVTLNGDMKRAWGSIQNHARIRCHFRLPRTNKEVCLLKAA